jgi:hypothetical protein
MSSLMFIGIVGPSIHKWSPQSYVKSWLASVRRDATSTDGQARKPKASNADKPDTAIKSAWRRFNYMLWN